MGKNLPAIQETWVPSQIGKISWRKAWQPTPIFLPRESPWAKEPVLVGYVLWGRKKSDTTEQLSTAQH